MTRDHVTRRRYLRASGAAAALGAAGVLAGCTDDGGDGGGVAATVTAGPGGDLVFDPDEVTISTGETVRWTFDSAGHNVSCVPEHNDRIQLPDGAEPFASYGVDGDKFETEDEGATYEHAFGTAGEYVYVCIPHASAGMVATVVVEG